jgi:hypothetical protein
VNGTHQKTTEVYFRRSIDLGIVYCWLPPRALQRAEVASVARDPAVAAHAARDEPDADARAGRDPEAAEREDPAAAADGDDRGAARGGVPDGL